MGQQHFESQLRSASIRHETEAEIATALMEPQPSGPLVTDAVVAFRLARYILAADVDYAAKLQARYAEGRIQVYEWDGFRRRRQRVVRGDEFADLVPHYPAG